MNLEALIATAEPLDGTVFDRERLLRIAALAGRLAWIAEAAAELLRSGDPGIRPDVGGPG